ncbi:hypothetical protein N480_00560 [Pseudoalteromonas luteoviolacea S2607]|uniref:rhomboid family intramembrane serine protease n=1 Tax=Pseudoalteromonas luteoviolacea TaxID=43657 RepID=UPI0007B0A5D9|nr:rhomboid family intramembrane serine protease [Pseudoalteromonas luteoviolacea]KZN39353.1 hypothetical protein N480_00560 [Pseudoalteromonas luteoviolacea S2607]
MESTSTYKPYFTFAICILTLCVSLFVALQVSGSFFGKSRIIYLADYGGITLQSIKDMELWRFLAAQLVHVHQKHMLYNVLSILLIGVILERYIGHKYMFAVWLIGGGVGTAFTTALGAAPWNTGTGASQAALAFAGFGLLFFATQRRSQYSLIIAILFAILPALYLDLKTAGYPKPTHILSFTIGVIIAAWYTWRPKLKG